MKREHTEMLIQRFLSSYEIITESGCWIWKGADNGQYGRFWIDGKRFYAHRLSYELFHGPIPKGLHCDHLCRVQLCGNPDHLRAVTRRENILAGIGATAQNARKTHCYRGHPLVKNNLINLRSGRRQCRLCSIEWQRKRRSCEKS